MWDLSCPDWEDRIRSGRSLIPDLPLMSEEAELALAMFDELELPDVPGTPPMRDACGLWFREIVRAAFGSWDPVARVRYIRDIFAMLPKGQSKTTYSAGLLLIIMLMNIRPRAEALFVAPTQAISENAYDKAVGMIDRKPELKRRFLPRDHIKTIVDQANGTELRVKTFDVNILTGSILIAALVDELHLLGRNAHTTKVMRQIRGGLEKTPEGLLIITTTQSDAAPVGAFKDELKFARKMRDGEYRGRDVRQMLPILYEFPRDIAADPAKWKDPDNWGLVMPNLGRSVQLPSLIADWNSEQEKGDHAIKVWASQHLNIEIGVGIADDGWRGADYWELRADTGLTLEALIARSEVAVVGLDGGGLDDLFGLCVIGREKVTRRWLVWSHAYAHPNVREVRKDIAATLDDFEAEGSLTFAEVSEYLAEIAAIVALLKSEGLLPAKDAVGFDPNNIAALIDTLAACGIEGPMLRRLLQGPALSPALWGLEHKLSDDTVSHAGLALMNWCVGNVKVEVKANGNMATKQAAGRAKIDPFIAMLCAAILMSWNPTAAGAGMAGFFKSLKGAAA
ncbi:terminase TerL endonuclease subunit [Ancylobacter polymorphus]|uniref:Terminase large subunit n=1 Tax=Ancylobacter polymorphus TaxID=223390 RepID=A0A9E6ZR15_9HYPH|nr:terminase TerL endonuclease subunit [Ancylobacter polymorphus]UOK70181.1 terminase large subunit [Ancylobacter polymorphus]